MPEPTKNDVVEITKKETVEIVTDGKTVAADSPLAAIFDKMEQGKSVEEAANEVRQPVERKEPVKADALPSPEVQKQLEESSLAKQLEADQLKKNAPAEVVETPEVQTEQKVPDKVEEVPEEELQVLTSDKPKTAKRIQALLERTRKIQESEASTKKELEARDAKLKEMEAELAKAKTVTVNPETEAAIQQQQQELAMFRRRYILEKDPEVKAKYDDRIAATEQPIAEILERNGAKGLAAIVKEEGGWLNFTRSNRTLTLADGPKSAAEVADLVMQHLPFADRQALQSITIEQISTKRERDRFFEEEQKKANEYFKQQEEAAKRGSLEQQQQIEAAKKIIADFKADMAAKNEWLKDKEIPVTATAEQKAAIEEENRHTHQIRQELDKAIGVKDIPGMLEVVKNAVSYHQERREHARTKAAAEALKAENAKLKSDLDKIKNASRTVNRPGSLLAGGGPESKSEKKSPQSIEEAFELLAQGKRLSDDE